MERLAYVIFVIAKNSGQRKKPCIRHNQTHDYSGAATQIRTGDLILTKDALYLLSYSSIFSFCLANRVA